MISHNLYALQNLINCILLIIIFIILISKNFKDSRTTFFSIFLFLGSIWSFFLFLWQITPYENNAILYFKIAMGAAILLVSALIHFVYIHLDLKKKYFRSLWVIHTINILFTICELTIFYGSFEERYGYGLWPNVKPIFHLFLIWWESLLIYTFLLVYKQGVKQKEGEERIRNKQLLLALSFAFIGGSTQWFLFYNINVPPYLVSTTSIMAIWIGYIVFRHKLFDIEIIIKKTALFTGLFFLAGFIIFAFSYLAQPLFSYLGIPRIFTHWLSFAIFILVFRPTEVFLENITNRWLYQRKVNYEKLLRSISETLKKIRDIPQLCQTIRNLLIDILQIRHLAVYAYDFHSEQFEIETDGDINDYIPNTFEANDPLILYLSKKDNILVKSDLTNTKLFSIMSVLQAEIIIPLKSSERLIGFILLGSKLSDQEYTPRDIATFESLQVPVAAAIENAFTLGRLKQSQIELAQKEKLATIGVLSAGIRHEINNPLFVVLGRSEMFLRNKKIQDWSKEKILNYVRNQFSSIKLNADRIKDIVERLSNFAKPIDKTEMERLNIRQVIDDSIKLLGYDEEGLANIDFDLQIDSEISCLGDARMLVQIFFNLINNAIHAMHFSGKITITVTQKDKHTYISIIDTGEGINPKDLNRIFDPFYTTKDTTRGDQETIKGTGLGLHLVYNYVQKMNGTIEVQSQLNVGTTFTVRLENFDDNEDKKQQSA